MRRQTVRSQLVMSPQLEDAPVLDRMCSHFVLTLTLRQGSRFNLRRDWNGLLAFVARHLVWPQPVLGRVREFLERRTKGMPAWDGQAALGPAAFLERFGTWRGPYEEATVFFYLD